MSDKINNSAGGEKIKKFKENIHAKDTLQEKNMQLQEQLRAAKDNIDFLKNEHAYMLRDLHEEIGCLQDKCRDLLHTCEVEGCILPDNDFFKCDAQTLEQKVDSFLKENADLKRKLSDTHQAIDILDQKEKLALWQHHQELEQRDTLILQLQKELESKCNLLTQVNSQGVRRKKGNFWRRFSFNTSGHPPSSSAVPPSKLHKTRIDHMSREDLPTEIQNSLPCHDSHYQSYSSYSSLSDKSVSDDEGFVQKYTSDPQQESEQDAKNSKLTVKLPPITNGPLVSSRQLVRHQLRIHSLANKAAADHLAIDHIPSPEVSVSRVNKT